MAKQYESKRERVLIEFLNTRTFCEIIDSFKYAFGRPPSRDEFADFGFMSIPKGCLHHLYFDSLRDWGFEVVHGIPPIFSATKDGIKLIGTAKDLSEQIKCREHAIPYCMRSSNEYVNGWNIKRYEGSMKEFWDDLSRKGYSKEKIMKEANDIYDCLEDFEW